MVTWARGAATRRPCRLELSPPNASHLGACVRVSPEARAASAKLAAEARRIRSCSSGSYNCSTCASSSAALVNPASRTSSATGSSASASGFGSRPDARSESVTGPSHSAGVGSSSSRRFGGAFHESGSALASSGGRPCRATTAATRRRLQPSPATEPLSGDVDRQAVERVGRSEPAVKLPQVDAVRGE